MTNIEVLAVKANECRFKKWQFEKAMKELREEIKNETNT